MTLWDIPQWILLITLFWLGAVVGSFLNVCIYRIPRHETVIGAMKALVHPPSTCPSCFHRILPIDNIPIFGWLFLRGRCRFCRYPISIRYPAIELLNGLLVAGLYIAIVPAGYGATIQDSCLWTPLSPLANPQFSHDQLVWYLHAQYAYYTLLAEALLVATFIDFDLKIIPDGVTVPAMIVGFLGAITIGHLELTPVWSVHPGMSVIYEHLLPAPFSSWGQSEGIPDWIRQYPHLHGFAVSLAGFLVGGGSVWTVRAIGHWILRREAMGFGDVILLAMIGSFIGWQASLLVFFLAPVFALMVVALVFLFRRDREIPYGPYLSLATLFLLVTWKWVWPGLSPLFSLGPLLPVMGFLLVVLLITSLLLVQGLKRLLGLPLFPEEEFLGEWTSADQLQFFASHPRQEPPNRLPRTPEWPGTQSGQGRGHYQQWRG